MSTNWLIVFFRNVILSNGFLKNDSDIFIPEDDEFLYDTFPKGFSWSAATASYQVEGGVNEGGMLC
jgi:hypothetical protein